MALSPNVGRKTLKVRLFMTIVYTSLIVMGVTMVVPFLITVTSSTSNSFDYERYSPVPRFIWSAKDRYVKGLVYFFNGYRSAFEQLRCYAPNMPSHWSSWSNAGSDIAGVDKFAEQNEQKFADNSDIIRKIAADYSDFFQDYPLADTTVTVITPQAINFMREFYRTQVLKDNSNAKNMSNAEIHQATLDLISQRWGLPYESFFNVNFNNDLSAPMDFQGWYPATESPKYQDFLSLKAAYRGQVFTPGVASKWFDFLNKNNYSYDNREFVFPVLENSPVELRNLWATFQREFAPASPCVPYALRASWYKFLKSENCSQLLQLDRQVFSINTYNELTNSNYAILEETPFPLPAEKIGNLAPVWQEFLQEYWPLRLTTITLNDEVRKRYVEFLTTEIKYIHIANQLLGTEHKEWSDFKLTAQAPEGVSDFEQNQRNLWNNFVKKLSVEFRHNSSSEISYQKFLLKKYGSLEKINSEYQWNLNYIEEAFPPFMDAYTVTFSNIEYPLTYNPILGNYSIISDYLFFNSNAIFVTVLLIVITLFFTLTINPLAAYAMSRFRLKGQQLIILFMLATMAFPAMVSAIPAYLLMRDLGLLNTFFALVLPGAANGMAIFILKGFFDSLPQELFEAATLDGASEFQIFRIVAMPLVKPILAINCLNAFIAAYNGWQWALIICQERSMWTIAVWMYQANIWWASMPWIVSAGFIVASIPTLIVFVSCQKIILRGIIIPSMK